MQINNTIQYNTNKSNQIKCIKYEDNKISNTTKTAFLAILSDDTLSWKRGIIPKLHSTCYAKR
jgi:hypothetical protein